MLIQSNEPVVRAAVADPGAAEQGSTPGAFTLTRSVVTAQPLTVYYSLAGTAWPGRDYLALPGRAVIPANAASVAIFVVPVDDLLRDPAETVQLDPLGGQGYGIDLRFPCAPLTILDND